MKAEPQRAQWYRRGHKVLKLKRFSFALLCDTFVFPSEWQKAGRALRLTFKLHRE